MCVKRCPSTISPAHLSVDAALHGPAVDGDVFLLVIEPVALGNPDHLLHQVQPSDTLRDGMLHLAEKPRLSVRD